MSRKVFNPVWFLALFLVFCLSFAPDGWGGWRGHGHDRDIRGDGADVHAAAPGSPVILDFWIDKINLGPAMATVYGGSVLADADTRVFDPDGLADIESVTIRTSGIPRDFSLYDDGTHGDFYSHDGEYSLRPFLNPPTGDYTFTATDRSGQTYQRMTALNDNNMPPPQPVAPLNGELIPTTTPTLQWYDFNKHTQSATIIVDGDPADWAGLTPAVVDPQGDSLCGGMDRDIKHVYTAMDSSYVYIMVETYGVPIHNSAAITIKADYKAGQHIAQEWPPISDLIVNFYTDTLAAWTDIDLNGFLEFYPISGYLVVRGSVIEARIPLSEIENAAYFNPTYVNIWDGVGCDPTEIATDYWVMIWDGVPDMTHIGKDLIWESDAFEGEVSVTPGFLIPGRTYYWIVGASSDKEGDAMEMWSFTVDGQPDPVAPLLSYPEDGAYLDSTISPAFYWTSNNNNAYSIDFSLDNFNTIAWRSYEDGGISLGDTYTLLPLNLWSKAPTNVPIYWRVRGAKVGGGITGPFTSGTRRFTRGFPHPGSLGQLTNIGSDRLGTHVYNGIPGWNNYIFSARMLSEDDDGVSLLSRYQDENNYYALNMGNDGRAAISVEKVVGGVSYWLGSLQWMYQPGVWYDFDVILNGQNIKVYRDGGLIFTIDDSTFSSGKVGLGSSWNEGSYFDDVVVTDLVGNPLFSDDFNDGNMDGWTVFDTPGAEEGPSSWFVSPVN